MLLKIERLSFQYPRHAVPAIDDMSCVIRSGITGLIGPNGAGKTTLFRLLLGILDAPRGTVSIDGLSPGAFRKTGRLGFIPDKPVFPASQTVRSFLDGLFRLQERTFVPPSELNALVDRRLDTLSLGEARRVELVAAFFSMPSLLLLDEPTNSLDPHAVVELRNKLRSLNDGSRIIIVASHNLDELQRIADSVVLIDHGRLLTTLDPRTISTHDGSLEEVFHALTSPRGD
jgi:ABC-2 type transport system ATP-binding protein